MNQVMPEIQKLIELWNARPQRVEPDNDAHLLYLFTGLLPALRDAMPKIVALIQTSAIGSPNIDLPPMPAPEPSSHTQGQSQNTGGSGEVSGPTTDNADIPASLPAIVGGTENAASVPLPGPTKRARGGKARKRAAVPRVQPQETGEIVMA